MNTKTWVISQLECLPQDGELKNFVVVCHWRRNAIEVDGDKTYYGDVYGAQSFSADNVENFTPYEDLTFDQVCGWLESSLDVESLDAALDAQIENQKNPPIVVLPLPWAPQPVGEIESLPAEIVPEEEA